MREKFEAAGAGQGFGPEARLGMHLGLVNPHGGSAEVRAHGAAENRRGAGEATPPGPVPYDPSKVRVKAGGEPGSA